MENNREQSSFWQFSDQLRLDNLSIGDSIWSDSFLNSGRRFEDRRNIDTAAASTAAIAPPDIKGFGGQKLAFGYNHFNKYNNVNNNDSSSGSVKGGNYFNSGINNNDSNYNNNNSSGQIKNYFNKAVSRPVNNGNGKKNSNTGDGNYGGKKKNSNNNNNNNNNNSSSNNGGNGVVDKRFKTLPPSEALPRSEAIGGYIFVCNNDTMHENLKRQLFGLPPRYRDSVRAITPGLPLFLYNYSTHQLHGIFEAASFGGTNIDPTAWEDKKCHGESRFPAQVRVMMRKICEPLEEDSFRPILHHYDGPKFRLELSVPEALALLDIFAEDNA